ncbi:MAG: CoB--CoM heterodisulfide reductase iron-sulfur subunit B family protein [Promethearchaeota archaeon]
MTEYKMFEGCTIGNRIPFIEAASRKVLDKIGVQTSQAPFSCCPDPTGMKSFDNDAWLAIGARNLCLAEAEGKPIISLCNGCANTLRGVKHQLKHDSLKMSKINAELAKIGKEFKGSVDVKHFVDVIKENLDAVKGAISKQLSGLKVACHPGCHYMRPAEWMESDDPLRPKNLKEIVAATGATVIDYDQLALCCGAAVTNAYQEHGLANLKRKLDSIKKAGANVICVNCPACFQQFDTMQRDLSKKYETDYNIPVLYLTELLALAMGISPDDIGLKFHRTRLKSLLENLGL